MKSAALPKRPHKAAPIPHTNEARQARDAARVISGVAALSKGSRSIRLALENRKCQPVVVPETAFRLFLKILKELGQGRAVTLKTTRPELTTQQAAELLSVSRPYVVKLLDGGIIPHHRVGTRRRVKLDHILAYLKKTRGESGAALQALVSQAQELKMGY